MDSIFCRDTLPYRIFQFSMEIPDKPAVISSGRTVTYAGLEKMVRSCCSSLKESGARRGGLILISAVMKAEYIVAFLAAKRLRMTAVPVNKTASESEASDLIARTGAEIFLTDNPRYKSLPQCSSLSASCEGDSLCDDGTNPDELIPSDETTEILFTTGTTGEPKGVVLSQGGISASIINTLTGAGMCSDDVILLPIPLNHSFGLRVMRSALYQGETLVLQNGFSFAAETLRNISEHRVNCAAVVNAGFEIHRRQAGNSYTEGFRKMRYIEFSAGAVPVKTRRTLVHDMPGVKMFNVWGSTETGSALYIDFSRDTEKISSAGRPINGIEASTLRISRKGGGGNNTGRLVIRSKALMKGYYNNPELTAEVLRDGSFITNDLAEIDSEGWVFLKGRIDDIINVGGEKVSPSEIEAIISSQPGVRECVCCGIDDPVLGQVPAAFIVPEGEGYDESQITAEIRRCGNGLMIPAKYVRLEAIPKNYMGKTDRKALVKLLDSSGKTSTADDFLKLITSRRSIRTFTEQPVEREMLEKILLAGRMAPTGHNMQTWRFTVLEDAGLIAKFRETVKNAASEHKAMFYGFNNPQALIIVSNDRRNPDAVKDSSAAIENMLLMAHALGLGGCWINALAEISDVPEIRTVLDGFGLPDTHKVDGIVALGWPVSVPAAPARRENVIRFIEKEEIS